MNKKFFTGMAVLLSASLFFLGCGGDDDPVPPPSPSEAETFADQFGGKAAVSGDTVTLTDNVSVTTAIEIPAGVTLSVPKDKVLTLGTGGNLTVTGTLAGAVDENDANVAAKVVVTAASTVTVGANVFYSTAGASVTTVAVGTYIWDAAAGGSDVAGWKQLQVVAAGTYTLQDYDNASSATGSDISIASMLKNTTTGLVTIKLRGQFKAEYLYYGDGKIATVAKAGTKWDPTASTSWPVWGDGSGDNFTPPAGKYGAVYVKGFFTAEKSNVAIQVKPYPGIRFYTGSAKFAANASLTTPATSDPCNYVAAAENDTQRWKKWATMPLGETFAVILYSGATNKIVKLDIDENFTSVDSKTDLLDVVIDYSDVTFAAAVTETSVAATYSLVKSEATNAATDTGTGASGITIASATRNPATNAVTITLTGTFAETHVYTGTGSVGVAGNAGASWDTTPATWGDGTDCTPPVGKYGGVYIKGLFGTATTQDAIQIKPYPALNFYSDYTGHTVSDVPLNGPNSVEPFNYTAGTESTRQRWKLYTSGHASGEAFGILLNSTATDKIVTLDIDQYESGSRTGDLLTVTINYNAVTFP
jgi:hypothetical protein